MRERLPQPVRRLVEAFMSFTSGQKAVTIIGVAALGLAGFFFYSWASKPSYAPLFSNLSGTDASAIVDELSGSGTPYELTDGGSTIMVPQDKVYDLRIQMSGAGLPAEAETGYSLLDKQGITTSDFMQHVGYQRALEGELSKTIKSIDGVTGATVHLAIPQKDIFSDDEKRPTASVLVTSRAGRQLEQGQVQAIVHLVASSVEGLKPEEVTVAGANGVMLSTGGGQGVAVGGDLRSQQTTDFEQRMNAALQRMVDSVVGPGHAVVTTTADLDFDQTETKKQTYVADPAVPALSQTTNKETYNGNGAGAGGVLGPDNIQVPTQGGTGEYESTTDTRNNAVGLVTETRESAPGNVRKLSVSVLLDARTAEGLDTAQIERLVSSAVGLDTQRGDTIAVTALPFDQSASEVAEKAAAEAQKAETLEQQISWAKTGATVLAVVVLLFLAWRASRRMNRRSRLTTAELVHLEQAQAALDRNRALALPGRDGDQTAAIEGGPPALESASAAAERDAHQRSIATMVQQQPDEVAQLLRGWLADRRT
jgi:flagellar M-ring protein FliF